jgi:hypothetical protein
MPTRKSSGSVICQLLGVLSQIVLVKTHGHCHCEPMVPAWPVGDKVCEAILADRVRPDPRFFVTSFLAVTWTIKVLILAMRY